MDIQRADGFVVQTGKPDGDVSGVGEGLWDWAEPHTDRGTPLTRTLASSRWAITTATPRPILTSALTCS